MRVHVLDLPTYAVAHGMSPELAFYLTAILNGASFFGRVIPGITADKVGRLNMLCIAGIGTGILCFCWQRAKSSASIITFAALYGFVSGAIISLMVACLAQIPKDPRNIGTYMGQGMMVISFAALIGPPVNGVIVTHYREYEQVSIFDGVVTLAGGLVILTIKQLSGKGILARI